MAPTEFQSEQRNAVLNQLIPRIATIIDDNEGLCSLNVISSDENVKKLLAEIPACFERKVHKILENYADYFHLLDGGRVATYTAYENGLLDENGNIVRAPKGGKKKNNALLGNKPSTGKMDQSSAPVPGNPFAAPSEDPIMTQVATHPFDDGADAVALGVDDIIGADEVVIKDFDGKEVLSLGDAADQLQTALFADDSKRLAHAFDVVRQMRSRELGTGAADDDAFRKLEQQRARSAASSQRLPRQNGLTNGRDRNVRGGLDHSSKSNDKARADPMSQRNQSMGLFSSLRDPLGRGDRDRDLGASGKDVRGGRGDNFSSSIVGAGTGRTLASVNAVSNAARVRQDLPRQGQSGRGLYSDAFGTSDRRKRGQDEKPSLGGEAITCVSGTSVPCANLPNGPDDKRDRVNLVTREMIVQLQAAPGQRRSVMEICQNPKIQQLKKNAINRFTSWVSDDNAHLFSLEKDGMGPKKGDAVVLIGDPVECDRIIFEYADLDSNYMEMFPQLGIQVERSDKPTKIRKIGGGGNGSLF